MFFFLAPSQVCPGENNNTFYLPLPLEELPPNATDPRWLQFQRPFDLYAADRIFLRCGEKVTYLLSGDRQYMLQKLKKQREQIKRMYRDEDIPKFPNVYGGLAKAFRARRNQLLC